jgi:hypothetical protein
MHGTSLLRVKQAVISELQERLSNVSYQSPTNPEGLLGTDGTGKAIWWSDEPEDEATVDVRVITGGPHWFDETVNVTLILQALGRNTGDDQETVDERATDMLGEVIGILASDPSVGVSDDSQIQLRTVLPTSWRKRSGVLTPDVRAAGYELTLTIDARVMLEAS